MTTLNNILNNITQKQISTDTGTKIHTLLQHITIDNDGTKIGNVEYIHKIEQVPNLKKFFSSDSKTELPIAGTINGNFISRRIDRILINHELKTIDILDYKSDITHDKHYIKYKSQIKEYIQLFQQIYPNYQINGYILWTHDFLLEKLPINTL